MYMLVGTRSSLASFLQMLVQRGPSFGLYPNLSKCEVFWPSGNQSFPEFPSSVTRISLLQEEGAAFLGSPVWGSSDYFLSFVGKAVDKVASLQDRLGGLGNPQVELHLLRSCLGVCKLNHLLRTISPNCVISQLERFDYNLRSALGRICKSSISDLSWLQATLPCSMGGLGLREATSTSSAAFLGSCFSSQELCYRLLQSFSGGPDVFPSIPDQDVATSILLPLINSDSLPDLIHPACGQRVFQHELDIARQTLLLNSLTIRDQARIRSISADPCTSSWLRAIPCDSLGLSMSSQEFVCSLRYRLGVPLFSAISPVRCPCGSVVDQFGDHLLGCGHGPMRIRRHDALCDVIYHALLQDNTGCRKEQRCAGSRLDRPGDVFHPDFVHGKPAYFDVTVRCPLQESLLGRSAVSAGVAAAKGEEDKDAHHDELVQAAGGVFVPLVVESLGLWSAASRPILQDIALRTTTRSGISRGLAYRHLLEQLSVCLWRHNARTFLHLFSLLPGSPLWELNSVSCSHSLQ